MRWVIPKVGRGRVDAARGGLVHTFTTATDETESEVYLLEIDPQAGRTMIRGFNQKQMPLANEEYLATEKRLKERPGAQAVLVAADSLAALRSAFPNYYADTSAFVEALERVVQD